MRGAAKVNINLEIPPGIQSLLRENEGTIAKMIGDEARSASSFQDKTGKLRGNIREEETKDGWIVRAKAPHAHLVEFGHGGPHPAPAHPFLRPAKEKVLRQIK